MKKKFINEKTIRRIVRRLILEKIDVGSGVSMSFRNLSLKDKSEGEEDLPPISNIDLEKISMEVAGKNASDLLSQLKNKKEDTHREDIVSAIHKPIYDLARGAGSFESTKDRHSKDKTLFQHYVDNLHKGNFAWSGWFLNRCYIGSKAESEIKTHCLRFSHSGCCYPWYRAIENRRKLSDNPGSFIGKSLLILASKKEVEKLGGFTDGDASVVGQGGAAPTLKWLASQKKLGSGKVHMNVKSGGSWIGGNLSNAVKSSGDDTGEANAFMIMVKVKGSEKAKPKDSKEKKEKAKPKDKSK